MMKSFSLNIRPRSACNALAATLLLILIGYASLPDVRVMSDPSVNFALYQTFAFVSPITTMPVLVEPNFGVGFYGGGYYGYRGSLYSPWPLYVDQTVVSNYKEGTLNIDIIDAAVTAAFARYPVGVVRN
jgi:hypothetical protein